MAQPVFIEYTTISASTHRNYNFKLPFDSTLAGTLRGVGKNGAISLTLVNRDAGDLLGFRINGGDIGYLEPDSSISWNKTDGLTISTLDLFCDQSGTAAVDVLIVANGEPA